MSFTIKMEDDSENKCVTSETSFREELVYVKEIPQLDEDPLSTYSIKQEFVIDFKPHHEPDIPTELILYAFFAAAEKGERTWNSFVEFPWSPPFTPNRRGVSTRRLTFRASRTSLALLAPGSPKWGVEVPMSTMFVKESPTASHAPESRPTPLHAPESRPAPSHAPESRPASSHAPESRPAPSPAPGPSHAPEPRPTLSPTHGTSRACPKAPLRVKRIEDLFSPESILSASEDSQQAKEQAIPVGPPRRVRIRGDVAGRRGRVRWTQAVPEATKRFLCGSLKGGEGMGYESFFCAKRARGEDPSTHRSHLPSESPVLLASESSSPAAACGSEVPSSAMFVKESPAASLTPEPLRVPETRHAPSPTHGTSREPRPAPSPTPGTSCLPEPRLAPSPTPGTSHTWSLHDRNIDLANHGSEGESGDEDLVGRTFREFPILPEEEEEVDAGLPASEQLPKAALPPPVQEPGAVNEPTSMFSFVWSSFSDPPLPSVVRRESFSQINRGPIAPMLTPYDAFVAIWDRQIMEYIAAETNKYAQYSTAILMQEGELYPHSRANLWTDTDADELYVYFAIILGTGMCTKNHMSEYWSKNTASLTYTPNFGRCMSKTRFELLNRYLHFNDNTADISHLSRPEAKLYKVAPIVEHLNRKFQELYRLDRNIALDESLTQWKGFSDIKQFIGNKTASVEIKTYEVYESQSGYLWRFDVHAGRDLDASPQEESPISGFIPRLVLRLLKGLEHQGHTVWMDNYYNSPALARLLKTLGFDCVGTLRTNRQLVPPELTALKKEQMVVGQIYGATSGDVDILVWRDHNRVAMISTYHGNSVYTREGKTKPIAVHDYNVCMGGVDKKDQMLAMYPIERKRTWVWYKKFFRRLLNVSVLNAFILHKSSSLPDDIDKVTSHREFRSTLISSLLEYHCNRLTNPPPSPAPSSGILHHLPAETGFEKNCKRHLRCLCVVCRKRTTFYCSGCNVALCITTCYGPYHARR